MSTQLAQVVAVLGLTIGMPAWFCIRAILAAQVTR